MCDDERAIDELCEAIRLTVEYVGTECLHPGEGWSWFDALAKYRPNIAQEFVEHHNRVVVPHVAVKNGFTDTEAHAMRAPDVPGRYV